MGNFKEQVFDSHGRLLRDKNIHQKKASSYDQYAARYSTHYFESLQMMSAVNYLNHLLSTVNVETMKYTSMNNQERLIRRTKRLRNAEIQLNLSTGRKKITIGGGPIKEVLPVRRKPPRGSDTGGGDNEKVFLKM